MFDWFLLLWCYSSTIFEGNCNLMDRNRCNNNTVNNSQANFQKGCKLTKQYLHQKCEWITKLGHLTPFHLSNTKCLPLYSYEHNISNSTHGPFNWWHHCKRKYYISMHQRNWRNHIFKVWHWFCISPLLILQQKL